MIVGRSWCPLRGVGPSPHCHFMWMSCHTPVCPTGLAPQLPAIRVRVRVRVIERETEELGLGLELGLLKFNLGLGLLKKKQKSELRVSRRCIEVERERYSFRSGQSKKCVAVSVCLSRTRGDQPLDTMGHSGARKHDRMCSVEHDASPGERREGAPWCTCSLPRLAPVR